MSEAQENAKCQTMPLTFEGRTIGQEIDQFLEDSGADLQGLVLGERLAITVVGQDGDQLSSYCVDVTRDEQGVPVASSLATEFIETDPQAGAKLFEQLRGGLWEWPVVEGE